MNSKFNLIFIGNIYLIFLSFERMPFSSLKEGRVVAKT
jgi:hypothetical protein